MATICLYGAASNRIEDRYINAVYDLGTKMAQRGHRMVYGAGATGLMGAAARGMTDAGGYIIGVTPHFLHTMEPVYDKCSEIIDTKTMAQRKEIMEAHADAFIIVPGGVGTLDEFFQVLTLKDLHQHTKPIILLNVDGYYNEIEAALQAGYAKGFIREDVMKMYMLCDTTEEALEEIEKH